MRPRTAKPPDILLASFVIFALASRCAGGPPNQGRTDDADHRRNIQLLDGVEVIAAPGVPGPLLVYGDQAFPVVVGGVSGKLHAPVVAAGTLGGGRVVAFGHTGYASRATMEVADTGRAMLNAVRWAARRERREDPRLKIGVHGCDLTQYFIDRGLEAGALEGNRWFEDLAEYDVLCFRPSDLQKEEITAITGFINAGGGVVGAGLGWGWLQLHAGKDLNDHPGNRIFAAAGIIWADGYLERTAKEGFVAGRTPPEMCHAARAVDALVSRTGGQSTPEVAAQASWTATHAARNLPKNDKLLRPRFGKMLAEHDAGLVPTKGRPITTKDALARFLLALQIDEIKDLSPERVPAHPAAEQFPGRVPADAADVARRIMIDCAVPAWHSTGLYARPGRVIVVEVPGKAVGAKLSLQIGAHSDGLWNKPSWSRVPEITCVFPLAEPKTRAASAFGGLVYISVSEGCKLGTIALSIRGVVEAPHYVHGKTGLDEWKASIRNRPAPWAELETTKIVLTLPSRVVRTLDKPDEVMNFWDAIADSAASLAALPLDRRRPERFVTDVQISAGYMHSGYPIMTHLDVAEVIVDVDRLESNGHGGVWGLYHELGHNHQSGDWTFAGTGEVTCNLFTLHAFDTVCGTTPAETGRAGPEFEKKHVKPYIDAGAKFDKWKSDPFLALQMYAQIQEAFGWDAFKQVFAEYRGLPRDQRPKTDDDKRDQWLVRLSRTVERNLGPFFQTWGVPTSDKARASISDLPAWMPDGFPPK